MKYLALLVVSTILFFLAYQEQANAGLKICIYEHNGIEYAAKTAIGGRCPAPPPPPVDETDSIVNGQKVHDPSCVISTLSSVEPDL